MRATLWLIVVGVMIVSACDELRRDIRLSENSIVFTDAMTRAAIPWLGRCDRNETAGITSTWTPSEDDIEAVEQVLDDRFSEALKNLPDEQQRTNVGEYNRQYFGVLRNGRRQIYVNGFRQDITLLLPSDAGSPENEANPVYPADSWLRNPVVMCEAGSAAFRADFDLTTRRLTPIRFSENFGGRVGR